MEALRLGEETRLPLWREEHEALRTSARAFVEREIAPSVEDWERAEDFPRELFARVGDAGFFAMKFAPEWGGSGPDFLAEAVWVQELARGGSGGIGADLGAHSSLALLYVDAFGSDEQKERYLTPGIAGTSLGALAITEPGTGSDVASIATTARPDGEGGWRLDGSKVFITNGAWSDWLVVAARTGDEPGHRGLSLFLVDAGSPGVSRTRMKMLGWRTSHTGELHFDGVVLRSDSLLGELGGGFRAIMRNFTWERLSMSLAAVAAAERTLDVAIAYARERQAFGRAVAKFQVWRHRFADLATEIALGRTLTEHALRLYVNGEDAMRATAQAKLVTQRLAWKVADEAVQVHGGYGYMMEYPVQRWWRDARLGPIGGGTDEIMKEIIARNYGL